MVTKLQRARQPEAKQARRDALLAAARTLFEGSDYDLVTMSAVAAKAKVSKGAVFLYYPTKETLFLDLLQAEFAGFFATLRTALASNGRWSIPRVLTVLRDALRERPQFLRLVTLLHSVLEKNLPLDVAQHFKQALLTELTVGGAALENRLTFLRPGEGVQVLLTGHALIVGFHQMAAQPGPQIREVLEQPQMQPLVIDFESNLTTALHHLLLGYEQRHRK